MNTYRYFITGPVGVGKSTLAKKLTQRFQTSWGGFLSRPYEKGYVLIDLLTDEQEPIAIKQGNSLRTITETFESLGVNSIMKAVEQNLPILMDEVGRFELKAEKFCATVLNVCTYYSPLVVVIKDERNEFLDTLRDITIGEIIYLTKDNREQIWERLGLQKR